MDDEYDERHTTLGPAPEPEPDPVDDEGNEDDAPEQLLAFSPVNSRITRGAVLCVVVAAIVLTLGYPLRQYIVEQHQIQQLRQQQAQQTESIKELNSQIQQWHDKAYVEQQARERLHYRLPGETLYQVVAAPAGR